MLLLLTAATLIIKLVTVLMLTEHLYLFWFRMNNHLRLAVCFFLATVVLSTYSALKFTYFDIADQFPFDALGGGRSSRLYVEKP